MWQLCERRRAEILTAVDQAEAVYARGGGMSVRTPEEAIALAAQIKRRGLARIGAEKNQ